MSIEALWWQLYGRKRQFDGLLKERRARKSGVRPEPFAEPRRGLGRRFMELSSRAVRDLA
jgi:hypothetical protein